MRLGCVTPAILRLADGRQHRGQLDALSLTGGLLSLPSVVDPGSRLKMLFVTHTGPVMASVQMLAPISTTGQPFQFLAVDEAHQRRLREVVQSSTETVQDAWVAKYRAALARPKPETWCCCGLGASSIGAARADGKCGLPAWSSTAQVIGGACGPRRNRPCGDE